MLHVCFSASASGIIRRILSARARREAVFTFVDDLSSGPIDDVCGTDRRAWYAEYFMTDKLEIDQLWEDQTRFWTTTLSTQSSLTIWVTRRSAAEYCGFLELLNRLPEKSEIYLIDFTELKLDGSNSNKSEACISIGYLNEESMDLGFKTQITTSPQEWLPQIHIWKNLKRENTPVRIVESNSLISKSGDYFDKFLTMHLSQNWQKMYRVAGEAVVSAWDNCHDIRFEWFYLRIRALVDSHTIEIKNGDTFLETNVRIIDPNII